MMRTFGVSVVPFLAMIATPSRGTFREHFMIVLDSDCIRVYSGSTHSHSAPFKVIVVPFLAMSTASRIGGPWLDCNVVFDRRNVASELGSEPSRFSLIEIEMRIF